jgi:hypothetical protein
MAEKKQGKDELNDYDRQDLTNAYENRPISTMGSDYLAEQSQLANSNLVEASRNYSRCFRCYSWYSIREQQAIANRRKLH